MSLLVWETSSLICEGPMMAPGLREQGIADLVGRQPSSLPIRERLTTQKTQSPPYIKQRGSEVRGSDGKLSRLTAANFSCCTQVLTKLLVFGDKLVSAEEAKSLKSM